MTFPFRVTSGGRCLRQVGSAGGGQADQIRQKADVRARSRREGGRIDFMDESQLELTQFLSHVKNSSK